jgi:hypothetical protein
MVRLGFLVAVKILVAPQAKADSAIVVTILEEVLCSSVLAATGHIAGTGLVPPSTELFVHVFRTGEQFDHAFAMVALLHRHLMVRTHAH